MLWFLFKLYIAIGCIMAAYAFCLIGVEEAERGTVFRTIRVPRWVHVAGAVCICLLMGAGWPWVLLRGVK
jgi:hypothetical protein